MPAEKKAFIQNGLDLDSQDRLVQGYRFALNVNIGSSDDDNKGAVENSKGNRLVSFTLPTGVLKVIGTFNDVVGSSIIYFLFNSSELHLILRFFLKDESITELARGPELEFTKDDLITGIDLDDDLLAWTNGVAPQRKINIVKADVNKQLKVSLYFVPLSPISTDYTLTIDDEDGNEVLDATVVFTVPGPDPATLDELTAGVTAGVNALPESPSDFTAIDAGTHVILTLTNIGYFDVLFSANTSVAIVAYDNMYHRPLLESYIDLLKSPPNFPPIVSFIADDQFKDISDLEGKIFEFRIRYLFDDGELSALGPVSKLPLSPTDYPIIEDNDSFIEVDYFDDRLSDSDELNVIRGVDLFVREENAGIWKKVTTLLIDEIVGTQGKFIFLNNEEYAALDVVDADKNFDSLPVLSNALSFMNNLLFMDAKVEGYDIVPTNVEITLDVQEDVPFGSTNDRGSFLKRPGSYKWGLIYFDRGNRSNTISKDPSMELEIPAYDADLSTFSYVEDPGTGPEFQKFGTVTANWKIKHIPPLFATHYCWARTLDSVHNDYLQTAVEGGTTDDKGGVLSVSVANPSVITTDAPHGLSTGQTVEISDVVTTPDINAQHVITVTGATTFTIPVDVTVVTDGVGNWRRILDVFYFKADRTTGTTFNDPDVAFVQLRFQGWTVFNDEFSEGTQGWPFAPGDKMRLLKGQADVFFTDIKTLKIAEKSDDVTFLVEVDNTIPEIKPNALVEFYTPGRPVENEIYFEIGEFFKVLNPGTSNRVHQGPLANQLPSDPIGDPAEGTFIDADNYRIIARDGGTSSRIIDSPRADQRFKQSLASYNAGRVNVYAPNVGQAQRGHTIRHSRKRFPGTNINGYSSFDSLNATDLDKDYGDVQHLARIDNIMLSLHSREAVSLYIEENIYTSVSGDPTVTVTKDAIGTDRVLAGGYGTDHPESFVRHKSRGYWFSSAKGEYVRYGGDGITSLSDILASTFFSDKGELLRKNTGNVFSTYDQFHDKIIVAFTDILDGIEVVDPAVTLSFDDGPLRRWTSFWDYLPEAMAMVDTKIVTFSKGELWIHDNKVRCNFYGEQFKAQIQPIFNDNPTIVKAYEAISVESDVLWIPIKIETPEGQLTVLQAGDFEKRENIFYAAILRDQNTPNLTNPVTEGDAMRSVVLKTLLENTDTTKAVLYFVTVQSEVSFLNNV